MLVSIITVAYNSSETITETIRSVNMQTYRNIEHILIDGDSDDDTVKIFSENATRNVKCISSPDKGIYDAMNKGLGAAAGDIIGFLNSDDCFAHKNAITMIVDGFRNGVDIVHGNLVFLDRHGKIKRIWDSVNFIPQDFKKSMSPAHPTFYCKRDVFNALKGFDINYRIAGDVDFMMRAILVNRYRFQHVNDILVKMKLGGKSTRSLKSRFVITFEVWNSLDRNQIEFSYLGYIVGKLKKAIHQIRL